MELDKKLVGHIWYAREEAKHIVSAFYDEQTDEDVLALSYFGFSSRNIALARVVGHKMHTTPLRRSGERYGVHVLHAAMIASALCEDDALLRQAAIDRALVHDLLEEEPIGYNAEAFAETDKGLLSDSVLRRSIVLLTKSNQGYDGFEAKVAVPIQLARAGAQADIVAHLADRIALAFDTQGYAPASALRRLIAPAMYSAERFESIGKAGIRAHAVMRRVKIDRGIPSLQLADEVRAYVRTELQLQREVEKELPKHFARYGVRM